MSSLYWILIGNKNTGSSRIHGWNVHKKLTKLGYNSNILVSPIPWMEDLPFSFEKYKRYFQFIRPKDILIIQKVFGHNTVKLIQYLKLRGVKIFFLDCDLPLKTEIVQYVPNLITPSKRLLSEYRTIVSKIENFYYLPDCPEFYINNSFKRQRGKYTCAWFGYYSEDKWNDFLELKKLITDRIGHKWNVISISNDHRADIFWRRKSYKTIISKCDAVIFPVIKRDLYSQMKSSNKVLQTMALNVPVLASPLDSYEEIIINGFNGFICRNDDDWIEALMKMEDQNESFIIRSNGYVTAKKFSLDVVIYDWINTLELTHDFKKKFNILRFVNCMKLKYLFSLLNNRKFKKIVSEFNDLFKSCSISRRTEESKSE